MWLLARLYSQLYKLKRDTCACDIEYMEVVLKLDAQQPWLKGAALESLLNYVGNFVVTQRPDVGIDYWATRPRAVSVEECSVGTVGERGMLDWK
jgi:hypothetical protein